MPELTYEQLFDRRVKRKGDDLREFLEKAEELRKSLSPSYDSEEAFVIEMRILLDGGKTLKGAHSESLVKIADLAWQHAPAHRNSAYLREVARKISDYHYSRMR